MDPSVSSQALDKLQNMVFDQSLRQLSKRSLKYCFVYLDDLLDGLVMVLGNRKILSFDLKKVKARSHRQLGATNPYIFWTEGPVSFLVVTAVYVRMQLHTWCFKSMSSASWSFIVVS